MCKRGMWMVAANEKTSSCVLFQVRCKMWDCPDCAKINSDMWIARAAHGAGYFHSLGFDLDMVTVTAHERHSPERAVSVLHDQWNKLRNRWQAITEKPQYMLVGEVGSRGHFHVHFLTYSSIGTRWWKDNARKAGFGFMAKESEKHVQPEKAGFYIGKYLFKQLQRDVYPKGYRRVRTSRLWPKLPPLDRSEDWGFTPFPLGMGIPRMASLLETQGYSVALADDRASWEFIRTGNLTEGCQPLTMTIPFSIPQEGTT